MKISRKEADYIVTLAKTEKPSKAIRTYLAMLGDESSRSTRQIEFYNKSYKSFYRDYFTKFAGRYRDDCILEAYTTGLSYLRSGADLDVAVVHGFKAGSDLFVTMSTEILVGNFEYVCGASEDDSEENCDE